MVVVIAIVFLCAAVACAASLWWGAALRVRPRPRLSQLRRRQLDQIVGGRTADVLHTPPDTSGSSLVSRFSSGGDEQDGSAPGGWGAPAAYLSRPVKLI